MSSSDLSGLEKCIRRVALSYSKSSTTMPPRAHFRKSDHQNKPSKIHSRKDSKLPKMPSLEKNKKPTLPTTKTTVAANASLGDMDPMIYEQFGTPRSYSSSKLNCSVIYY